MIDSIINTLQYLSVFALLGVYAWSIYRLGRSVGRNETIVNVLKDEDILHELNESEDYSRKWNELKDIIEDAIDEGNTNGYYKASGTEDCGKYWAYFNILEEIDRIERGKK